jgi:hypothetical protein
LGSALALIGCLHVAISVYLCYAFLRPLWHADRLGGADPAMRAQMRRVLIATVVAVASTLVCYCNPVIGIANPCVLFAVDSIINDMALAVLALTDAGGDAKVARDASGLRVGVAPDDSPGLELSDGAVLS